jgi:hypothetical protein
MGEKLEASKYPTEKTADESRMIFDDCRYYGVEDTVWCKHANWRSRKA